MMMMMIMMIRQVSVLSFRGFAERAACEGLTYHAGSSITGGITG